MLMLSKRIKRRVNLIKEDTNRGVKRSISLYYLKMRFERQRLEENRDIYPIKKENPLISIRIPTYNRADILVNRTLAGILRQTYKNFEVVIVADHCTDNTEELVKGIGDPRIRFYNSQAYPKEHFMDSEKRWFVPGYTALTQALDLCIGDWIATTDDDDEWHPDHLEKLLKLAMDNNYEVVYSKVKRELEENVWDTVGDGIFEWGRVSHASVMYNKRLAFLRYSRDCWKYKMPYDGEFFDRLRMLGARIGFLNEVTAIHYREQNAAYLSEKVETKDEEEIKRLQAFKDSNE